MKKREKSKLGAVSAALLMGSFSSWSIANNAVAQTAQSGSAIPETEIRGTISQDDEQTNQGNINNDPIVLGSQGDENSVLDGFDTSLNDDLIDLNSEEGRRQQPAQNPVGGDQQQENRRRRLQAQRAGPVGVDPDDPTSSPRSNLAVTPVQSGNAGLQDDEPFAATGFRLGTFDVQASIEQALGYSSNISGNVDGEAGGFSQTDVDINFTSNWSRHAWQTNFSGSYRLPFDSEEVDEPLFTADTLLRLDLIDGYTLTASGFYVAETQEFTDTTLAPGAVDTPLEQAYGGSLELARSDRKFVYSLRGTIEREVFEDADLGGGVFQIQEDQNNNTYGVSLRVGYEVSPALTPFVEGSYAIREFDLDVDRNGNRRDGDIFELRAGAEIDLGEKLQGEVSIGYLTEQFDDPLIEDLTGVSINGELVWSPERDSNVTLSFGTETNNSIAANDNGTLTYNARVAYDRQISARFSIDGFAGFEIETNDDRNTTIEIGVGTQYWVNRFMALTADVEYENFSSDAPQSGFDEVSGRLGVRLQR